jgi:hypothetical protein
VKSSTCFEKVLKVRSDLDDLEEELYRAISKSEGIAEFERDSIMYAYDSVVDMLTSMITLNLRMAVMLRNYEENRTI